MRMAAHGVAGARKLRTFALAGLLFAVLVVLQYRGVLPGASSAPGDAGDSRLNMLMLEHTHQSLLRHETLLSPPIYFPTAGTGAFSDLHLGTVGPYSIARLLGAAPFLALQIWILVGLVGNYLAAYVVARRWRLGTLEANVAAMVFTFAFAVVSQDFHLQLLWRWPIPLAAYWLHRAARERSIPALVPAVGWISLASLDSPYVGFLGVLWLSTFVVVSLFGRRSRPTGRARRYRPHPLTVVWVAAVFVGNAVLLLKYSHYSHVYHIVRPLSETRMYSPHWWSWVSDKQDEWWHSVNDLLPHQPGASECQLFVGVVPLLLAVLGLAPRRAGEPVGVSRWRLFVPVMLTVLAVTVVNGNSVFLEVSRLPGINAFRTPGRVVTVLLFPVAILAGLGLRRLSEIAKPPALLAVVLIVVEFGGADTPLTERSSWYPQLSVAERSQVATILSAHPDAVFLHADPAATRYEPLVQLDGMVVAREYGRPTINGYSGWGSFIPPLAKNCADVSNWLRDGYPPSFVHDPRVTTESTVDVVVLVGDSVCLEHAQLNGTAAPVRP